MKEFFHQFICPDRNEYSLIIEDDAKVCYAYLMSEEKIVGDVWLYNTATTPASVDWKNKDDMPFLNPSKYVDENKVISPISNSDQVELRWNMQQNELINVEILLGKRVVAKLAPGSKPGWSVAVSKDGPLAKCMITNP
jgi:hypothetical protein